MEKKKQKINCKVFDCQHCDCDDCVCVLNEISVCNCCDDRNKEATMCNSYDRRKK